MNDPTAIGLDLGGTKIEVQVFDAAWAVLRRNRVDTPKSYDALVAAMTQQIAWAALPGAPVGIAAAGIVAPQTGLVLAANLPATGKPFPRDIAAASGRAVTYLNDCRAMILSEATFGAAKGQSPVVGLILGTGVGGGVAIGGALLDGGSHVGGEFGHSPAPAHLVAEHGLPIMRCGCGRTGCIETYISGPGLSRIAAHVMGQTQSPHDLAALRGHDAGADAVWAIWSALVAELILTLTLTIDPRCVVLGGGLSLVAGITQDIQSALRGAQLPGFDVPKIVLAQGGATSGARGAAYAAWFAQNGGTDADA